MNLRPFWEVTSRILCWKLAGSFLLFHEKESVSVWRRMFVIWMKLFFLSERWLENLKALTKDLVVQLQQSQLPEPALKKHTGLCLIRTSLGHFYDECVFVFTLTRQMCTGFTQKYPARARYTCWSLLQLQPNTHTHFPLTQGYNSTLKLKYLIIT